MSVSPLDSRTADYLDRRANEIGFIGDAHISSRLQDLVPDQHLAEIDTAQFRNRSVTIYRVAAEELRRIGLDLGDLDAAPADVSGPDRGRSRAVYAAAWTNDAGGDAESATVLSLFRTRPERDEMREAFEIRQLQHDLQFGDCDSLYECRDCGKLTHWLSVADETDDPVSLSVRKRALEHRRCRRCHEPSRHSA